MSPIDDNGLGRSTNAPRKSSPKEKVLIIVGLICLLLGFVTSLCGYWSSGLGEQGVIGKLIQGVGFGVLALGTLVFAFIFGKWLIADLACKAPMGRRKLLKQGALVLLMLAFSVGLIIGCAFWAGNAVRDLRDGPETVDAFLVDANINHPAGRYGAFFQDSHVLTFSTADDERIILGIPESDMAAANVGEEPGTFIRLTYYPHSQVFCEATPLPDSH